MSDTKNNGLSQLKIAPEKKARRRGGGLLSLVSLAVLAVLAGGAYVATRDGGLILFADHSAPRASTPPPTTTAPAPPKAGDAVLAVSGYMVPRERIELSPRFQGTVKWIGVHKGDRVKKGQLIVQLDDAEYRAKTLQAEGELTRAQANLANAEANLKRQEELVRHNVDSARALDDARRARDVAAAEITVAKGQLALAQTYLDWCQIRSPISGTILEKLVEADELVTPITYGGTRGPSTAFVSMADLNDLQVEIDLNEADLAKVYLKQRCRISPEAYPNKKYSGYVVEIAPEANRQKGTLQLKVRVENPDTFLTPELSAKVEFLADAAAR